MARIQSEIASFVLSGGGGVDYAAGFRTRDRKMDLLEIGVSVVDWIGLT
jgi:hypothetical protein